MANNKVSSLLSKQLPRPPRSNFNLGRVNRFTADVGYVIPCYVEEVLPNSYKRLDVEGLINTNATVAPFMGSFTVKVDAFFVPLRLYHRHLSLNNIRPDFHSDFDFHVFRTFIESSSDQYGMTVPVAGASPAESGMPPYVTTSMSVAPSSLIDYLGILPVDWTSRNHKVSLSLNGEPFVAYFDIWRNYYANPHDRRVPFRVQNFYDPTNAFPMPDDAYGIGNTGVVRYFNLDDLDRFITQVSDNSVTLSGPEYVPASVNVLSTFWASVTDDSFDFTDIANSSFSPSHYSVPFYAGQGHLIQTYDNNLAERQEFDTRDGIHFGLLPRTYKDDYFNSRFMNDFVQYMEETATVTVENNSFNITQLRLANRIAKYVDKSIFSDTRFGAWIKAHFGVKTNSKLDIPQFLGSMTSTLLFNDIYATAQTAQDGTVTDNTALGSRSSLGQSYLKNKGAFVEFQATEPGYIMCMFSLIPNVSYFQGIRKMYLKNSFNDLYKPEFDAVGYQDLLRIEMDAVGNYIPVDAVYRDQYNNMAVSNVPAYLGGYYDNDLYEVVGKHPAWLEYMCAYDESHGLMTQRYQYGYWTNNRPYNSNVYEQLSESPGTETTDGLIRGYVPAPTVFDSSTYIRSEYFNTIFAVDKFTDNFQVQLRFYDKTKQPMSKQVLPSL